MPRRWLMQGFGSIRWPTATPVSPAGHRLPDFLSIESKNRRVERGRGAVLCLAEKPYPLTAGIDALPVDVVA